MNVEDNIEVPSYYEGYRLAMSSDGDLWLVDEQTGEMCPATPEEAAPDLHLLCVQIDAETHRVREATALVREFVEALNAAC